MKSVGAFFLVMALLTIVFIFLRFFASQSKSEFKKYFGLRFKKSLIKETIYGILFGIVLVTGIFFSLLLSSAVSDIKVINSISSLFLVKETAFAFLSSMVEEFLFRSVILGGIYYLSGQKWWALFVSSLLFGFAHAANPEADIISIISHFMGGVMYGLAFLGTRHIWFPTGLHFSWNYCQGTVLGFNVSGSKRTGLMEIELRGSELVTGGDYGLEASIIGIGFRLICIIILIIWFRNNLFQN